MNRVLTCSSSFVLAGILILAATTSTMGSVRTAFAQEQAEDKDVSFVADIEMIKGHLAQAVANKENNDLALAKAHATHPIAELYTLVEPEIQEHNDQLNTQIKTALTDLSGKVDSLPAVDFKAESDRINSMLDSATNDVVPETKRSDIKFNAQVISSLLSTAVEEYEEAVTDGKVSAMVEYQDGQAFIARAQTIFNSVSSKMPEHKDETNAFFADLNNAINDVKDPEDVEKIINAIISEVKEGAGIEEEESDQATLSVEYIGKAKQLLEQLSAEYAESNFTGADKLAVIAYLDNFEHVESDLAKAGSRDLSDEIEQMMRVQLRDLIKNKVPQEQLDAHISAINTKLDQAIAVVPEFPVAVLLAIASVVGIVVAVTRIRGTNHFK